MTAMTDDRLAEIELCVRLLPPGGMVRELLAEVKRLRALQSEPSWDDAPEWAQWLAMDESGEWWWWENEPSPDDEISEWLPSDWNSRRAPEPLPPSRDWRSTLQERPK